MESSIPESGSALAIHSLVDGSGQDSPTCALEFKPPDSTKGECVRGLGQALTYLDEYESSALLLPEKARDGFEIANYIATTKSLPHGVGVYSYEANSAVRNSGAIRLRLLKPIGGSPSTRTPGERPKAERTFWAFWRDISLNEFFLALSYLDRSDGVHRKRRALASVFGNYRRRRTRDPQGAPRKKANISERDFSAHLSVTLSHLGLWDQDGLLTPAGRSLVHTGRAFGWKSSRFRDEFASRALLEGRHYQLVKLVYEFQQASNSAPHTPSDFRNSLEEYLENQRLLRRLPGRRTTGSRSFFKAEFTFWGQMLRIIRHHGTSYVGSGGVDFDWPRIVELLGLRA
jgi:hypothetical protein